jgi:DNA-binding NtrC family response regulator
VSTPPTLLLVDDEKNTREGLARALKRHYQVLLADSGETALRLLEHQPVDIVLSDVRMPGMDGLTLLPRLLARTPPPLVILLTAYGSVDLAVEAMKRGAYDFLTKPVNLDRLEIVLKRALHGRALEAENQELRGKLNDPPGLENLIGRSAGMEEVLALVRQVAPTRATVLVTGESGTGKELVARALHTLSPRAAAPFIALHCAALSEGLLESELFGHEKGAFTGASERRRGRFELADGGTLFLDEVGEVPASTQVKLLRVLEERKFERVGGSQTLEVDVRLVAATNRDLKAMVAAGDFREDLYFRLNVVEIRLPPLRQRTEDIPLLVEHYRQRFAADNGRAVEGLTPDALEALLAYPWPGNIRELRNVVERMVVLSRGPRLTLRDVPAEIRDALPTRAAGLAPAERTLRGAERVAIERALQDHDGNRVRAAEELRISRRTLHRKIREYGIRQPARRGRPPLRPD